MYFCGEKISQEIKQRLGKLPSLWCCWPPSGLFPAVMAFTVQFLLFLALGAREVVLMCSLSRGGLFFLTVQILSLPPYSLFSELPIVLLLLGVNVCWCLKVVNHSLADTREVTTLETQISCLCPHWP